MADGSDPKDLVALSNRTLSDLPPQIKRPRYDRARLTPGIVHIGLGNFHRAHQAWYLHRLMQNGQALDWAIIGAGVRPADAAQRARLVGQDCLTTLIELDPTRKSAEIVGSMIDYVPVDADNASLIRQLTDPRIRIASLTVTEGGYFVDPATGGFDANDPDIQHDATHPDTPRTAFGAMIAALRHRRESGVAAFTCQSCDNLQGNGDILRQAIVSLARLSDPGLADWIDTQCGFPNSMVDCIVPATGPNEIALANAFGIRDAAPVTHETFRQWVIDDDFPAGRPPWEASGATITNRVHDYETMKIRILNGGHQVIAGVGELLHLNTIAQAVSHPLIRKMLRKVAIQEIIPHVPATPQMQPIDYLDLIERRFANAEIQDTTRRVAFDGSSRHPGFIMPTMRDGLERGTPIDGLALVSALWSRYCEGTREDGSLIKPNDPNWDDLQRTALVSRNAPEAWLSMERIYGDAGQHPRLGTAFAKWRRLISQRGVEAALRVYIEA